MTLKLLNQGLIFLLYLALIQCGEQEQNDEIKNRAFPRVGHHVLQNGRIVSKPVNQPLPVDQMQVPPLQGDDINQSRPKYIANGDILTPIEEIAHSKSKRTKRKVIAETSVFSGSNRWPGGVVPYDFVSGINYQTRRNVLGAIQHWHTLTCIRFEPYNYQRHWNIAAKITIDDAGSGCATFVGYRPFLDGNPSSYSVYLPSNCPLGSAIHELGHVIGFYHEMARTDRDKEIILYFNRMPRSEAAQYDIMPNPMPGYYGQPYDLGSIMHYRPTENVMAARDDLRSFLMGQRTALSFLDTKLANLAYHCSDKCNPKPVCENEGYVSQYCKCVCPDGFYGDRCHLLQGYIPTNRVFPSTENSSLLIEVEGPHSTTAPTKPPTGIHWLEWSAWSNCSESCGSGIRVRTRLCSNTTIDGGSDPCSSLGGDSFEIESCQNVKCTQTNVIISCTFDFPNEKCPLKNENNWEKQSGSQTNQFRPVSDHTIGDGKYLIIIGNATRSVRSQKFRLGPLSHSKTSNDKNHCLQFWYSARGQGIGRVTIDHKKTDDETFVFHEKGQDTAWKQIQRTIPNNDDYELIFTYESNATNHNHLAIDDITVISGVCPTKKIDHRKRRQVNTDCSRIIDLTTSNRNAIITSPNYPNLYPSNARCYYYIRAPQSSRIVLQFTDFNVPTDNSGDCGDGIEMRYYHLGQRGPIYCGSGANSNNVRFLSTKNNLMLFFYTNEYFAGRGFRAQATLAQ